MDNIEKLKDLLLSGDGMLISLRMGQGLDNEKVNEICEVLILLKEEWKEKKEISKKAVDIFVDFFPAMEMVSDYYSENEAVEIMNAADKIMDLIRDCII